MQLYTRVCWAYEYTRDEHLCEKHVTSSRPLALCPGPSLHVQIGSGVLSSLSCHMLITCSSHVEVLPWLLDFQVQYLTSMSVELHIRTRSSLRPDPECDPILAVFYYIYNDWPGDGEENAQLGVMAIDVDNCNFSSPVKVKKEDRESRGRGEKLPPRSPTKGATVLKSPAKEALSHLGASFAGEAGDYLAHCGISSDVAISYASSEVELIERVTQLVRR